MKEILLTSSVLIAVIILLRQLFKNKISHRLQYAIWLLVAIRLLIPVEFGDFRFSVTSLTQESKPLVSIEEASREPIAGPSYEEIYQSVSQEYVQQGQDVSSPQIQSQLRQETQNRITVPTLGEIATAVWIAGIAVMGIWFFTVNLGFSRRAKRNAQRLDIPESPVPVRISGDLSSPCLVGLIRPVIYLTPGCAGDPQKMDHVLAHELTHLRHWDHIWSLVRCVCLCVYWFDPLVWVAAILSKRDCELACDEGALKKLGEKARLAYGKTLVDMVAQDRSPKHLMETATAMNESKKQLTERVKFIVKKPKYYILATVCLLLAAALTVGCTFTGAMNSGSATTEGIFTAVVPADATSAEIEVSESEITIRITQPGQEAATETYPKTELSQIDRVIAMENLGALRISAAGATELEQYYIYKALGDLPSEKTKLTLQSFTTAQKGLSSCIAEEIHFDRCFIHELGSLKAKTLSFSFCEAARDDWPSANAFLQLETFGLQWSNNSERPDSLKELLSSETLRDLYLQAPKAGSTTVPAGIVMKSPQEAIEKYVSLAYPCSELADFLGGTDRKVQVTFHTQTSTLTPFSTENQPESPELPTSRTVVPLPPEYTVEDLVGDYWFRQLEWKAQDGSAQSVLISIPQIRPFSSLAVEFEQSINYSVVPYAQEALQAMEAGESTNIKSIDYKACLNDNFLSILLWVEFTDRATEYFAINLDTPGTSYVRTRELLALHGLTEEECSNAIVEALTKLGETPTDSYYEFNSDEFILNEDGVLVALIPITDAKTGTQFTKLISLPDLIPGNENRVAQMKQLLEGEPTSWFHRATTSIYYAPGEVDLGKLFQAGGETPDIKLSGAERSYLKTTPLAEVMEQYDIVRVSVTEMNEILQKYFGLTLEETNMAGLENAVYWEETDSYYMKYVGLNAPQMHIQGISPYSTETVKIIYTYSTPDEDYDIHLSTRRVYCLTLIPTEDGYQVSYNRMANY